jgi:hypothetical protein
MSSCPFQNGRGSHRNNIQSGEFGHYQSNVFWWWACGVMRGAGGVLSGHFLGLEKCATKSGLSDVGLLVL